MIAFFGNWLATTFSTDMLIYELQGFDKMSIEAIARLKKEYEISGARKYYCPESGLQIY